MADRALTTRQNANPGSVRYGTEARILRDRQAAQAAALDRQTDRPPPYSSARMLVQVYDGGSMPTAAERVYFTHPVLVTGSEAEGGAGTLSVDAATTVPVIVLQNAAAVNDYLTAYAVGGRWVAERGGVSGGGGVTGCLPCNIPNENLTISWTNLLTGDGSATMTFGGGPSWATGCCDNGLMFTLGCNSGSIELRAIFFVSGTCPTGSSNYCSNLRAGPLSLTLESHSCSPFSLTLALTEAGCPELFDEGNTQFTITR
jgi:hypothetical protein